MDFELTPEEMAFLLHTRTVCGLTVILNEDDKASLAANFVGTNHHYIPDKPDEASGFLSAA